MGESTGPGDRTSESESHTLVLCLHAEDSSPRDPGFLPSQVGLYPNLLLGLHRGADTLVPNTVPTYGKRELVVSITDELKGF